jgi:putative effector of murein hydrolase
MAEVVQLWIYLSTTPLFGLTATLVVYVLVHAAHERLGRPTWANTVLWSVLLLGLVLLATATPYPRYFAGAQFVHVLLGPAVVALGWPLWQRRAELRRRGLALVLASLIGGTAAAVSAVALGWALGLPDEVLRSVAPKSVTSAVAMGITERLGGMPALTAVLTAVTGMVGALSARPLLNALRIHDWPVRGFALGTAAHGIGAARALQVHADAGAYAGLALGLQAILASLLMPLAFRLWTS